MRKMKKYRNLCIKDITGEISIKEKLMLDEWLAASEENKKVYEEIKVLWNNAVPAQPSELPDADLDWQNLSTVFVNGHKEKSSPLRFRDVFEYFTTGLRPALSLAVVLLLAVTAVLIWNNNSNIDISQKFVTGANEKREVKLPDGSKVMLNYNSSVEFTESTDRQIREAKLNGEAYFSVAKNKFPFVVATQDAKVTVVGTKFNVWSRNEGTQVFVKEGVVNIRHNVDKGPGINLTKGEKGVISKNKIVNAPVKVGSDYMLSWLDGNIKFNKTPLTEIAGELTRFYNTNVYLDSSGIGQLTLTGSFDRMPLDSVLNMMCIALNLDYEKNANGYLIKIKKDIQ